MEEWFFACDEEGVSWVGADYLREGGVMLDEGYCSDRRDVWAKRWVRWLR